jgi:hypothetical protein
MMDEGSEAETNLDSRELYFKATDFDTVLHEVVHIYFRGTYIRYTSNMDVADFEEVAVSLFADRGKLMIQQAEEIRAKLRALA